MRRLNSYWIAFGSIVAVTFAVGCGPSAAPKATTTAERAQKADAKKPVAQPTALELPASLRHAGFLHSGLARETPLRYRVTGGPQGGGETSRTAKLVKVENERATFEVASTGMLDQFGVETVVVDASGVSVTGYARATVARPALQLPANFGAGSTWKSDFAIEAGGVEVSVRGDNRVVRREMVTVPAGEFNAWVVVTTGNVTTQHGEGTTRVTQWMAEGIGVVRQVIVTQTPNMPDQELRLELIGM